MQSNFHPYTCHVTSCLVGQAEPVYSQLTWEVLLPLSGLTNQQPPGCGHAYSSLEVFGVSTSRFLGTPALPLVLVLVPVVLPLTSSAGWKYLVSQIMAGCLRIGCSFLSGVLAGLLALLLEVVNVGKLISCLNDFHSCAQHPVMVLSLYEVSLVIVNMEQISLETNKTRKYRKYLL